MLNGKVILITGGTGSFGTKCTEIVLKKYKPKKLIIFSRDEYKQYEMAKTFGTDRYPIRYFLGDVRDRSRLHHAFRDVDYIIHAAALKGIPALEYNPTEAIKTNIIGAENVIDAAIDAGVKKVVAISTDKAVNPINLYGATKLAAEKIFIAANAYSGNRVKFSVVRYGNIVGSRGSVIPVFLHFKKNNIKRFTITDERMSRFWATSEEAVRAALTALKESEGGEVFVPNLPSMKVVDLARAIEPACTFKINGTRPGEKLHEVLISEDETGRVKLFKGDFVILPSFFERSEMHKKYAKYPSMPAGFSLRSDKNKKVLTTRVLLKMIRKTQS